MSDTNIQTIFMHGPKISDPSKTDSRAVPLNDVAAYQAAGWVVGEQPISEGPMPEEKPAEEQKPIKGDKRKAKKK